jgi:hypothetical protein
LPALVSVALAAAAFFTIAGLVAVVPLLGASAAAVVGLVLAVRRPGALLALALSGFFVYLAVVDVAGRGTATIEYDAVLAGLMLFAAWRGRAVLAARLRVLGRLETMWLVSAALLVAWFLGNGLLYRVGGHEAHLLMALLVLVTLPSLALALSLDQHGLADLRRWIVALGLGLVVGDVIAVLVGTPLIAGRFSPIERLDPINAGLVPALAGAVALSAPVRGKRARILQTLLLAALVAGTVLPGSRGPVLALALTLALGALVAPRSLAAVAVAGFAIGLALGYPASKSLGTEQYLSQGVTDVVTGIQGGRGNPNGAGAGSEPGSPGAPTNVDLVRVLGGFTGGARTTAQASESTLPPISTFRIRRYWLMSALKAAPDKPLLGHGLVALPDNSPEAHRMGVAGMVVYPHNDLVESVYSLGIAGLVLFLLLIGLPMVAGYRLLRRTGGAVPLLVALMFTFAFFESNFSGEIGADSLLWASAGLLVALSLDRRRTGV